MHMLFATSSTDGDFKSNHLSDPHLSSKLFPIHFDISDALPSFFTVAWTVQE